MENNRTPAVKRFLTFALFLALSTGYGSLAAQNETLKVLFLGNSYTASNNLPQIVEDIASSAGDSLYWQQVVSGGQYLEAHAADPNVATAFAAEDWDYIVLQEQSQIPVIPFFRQNLMYVGADSLEGLRQQLAPCAEFMMFLTWGRENGGQQCNGGYCSVDFTDFHHYQDTLTWAYQVVADDIGAGIAPNGECWRTALLSDSLAPAPLDLFSSDGSHPAIEGSYLAGLSLYASMFEKTVQSRVSWHPNGVDSTMAVYYRWAADTTIWPNLAAWRLDTTDTLPTPSYTLTSNEDTAFFVINPEPGWQYEWVLENGDTLSGDSATYLFDTTGVYYAQLKAVGQCDSLTLIDSVEINLTVTSAPSALSSNGFEVFPNPVRAGQVLQLQLPANAGAVRWELLSLEGQRWAAGQLQDAQTARLPLPDALPTGAFLLRVTTPRGQRFHRRLLVK